MLSYMVGMGKGLRKGQGSVAGVYGVGGLSESMFRIGMNNRTDAGIGS